MLSASAGLVQRRLLRANHVRAHHAGGAATRRRRGVDRVDAEDTPDASVELEGLERSIQVVTRYTERTARPVLQEEVEVASRPDAVLRALPLRERVCAEDGRAIGVRVLPGPPPSCAPSPPGGVFGQRTDEPLA